MPGQEHPHAGDLQPVPDVRERAAYVGEEALGLVVGDKVDADRDADREERRQEAGGATPIERDQVDAPRVPGLDQEERSDEEAREHEEDVDADRARVREQPGVRHDARRTATPRRPSSPGR